MIKKCEQCGKVFKAKYSNDQRFCSHDCQHRNYSDSMRKKREAKAKALKSGKENMEYIKYVDRLAKKEGMSYGQFVATYGW